MKLCTYLTNVARYCIWQGRNAVKFDRTSFDLCLYFNAIVKGVSKSKHLKLNIYDFEILWADNNAFFGSTVVISVYCIVVVV